MKITVKHLFAMLYATLLLSLGAGFVVFLYLHPEVHFFWERVPVFSALYGFIGGVLIILGSRAIGQLWLQRKEDYYENYDSDSRL